MPHPHMSTTVIGIVLVIVAGVFYAAFVLYGAWIDGRRQKIRENGQHPVTDSSGGVHAREADRSEQTSGPKR
jgi:hypothetical protein